MAAKEALKLAPLTSNDKRDDIGDLGFSSSDSESEDESSKHENLLKVIETLDKKSKKRKKIQRSEPNLKVSEFHLSSCADGDKVDLSDLIGSLQKGSGYGGLKKKLASMEKNSAPMDLPLHKPQADRIQRTVAYEETSKDISKWQPIVKKNREAEHLSFPLKPYEPTEMTTKTLAVTFKPRTPLEEEVAAILKGSSHVIERENKELTEEEEQALLAMDLEEAKDRRHELQRMRALQSYYEEKCRRAKKIKSKKYHRIKKRAEKRAANKQSLNELQKTDPEKAQEEIDKLDKIRAEERVSLKHRNTSKWAKNLLIHGHKDPEAKKALQDQLLLSRQLTEKQQQESEEEEETQEAGAEDDVTSGAYGGLVTSADNPWSIDKTGDRVGEGAADDGETAKLQRLQPVAAKEHPAVDAELESTDDEKEEDDFELQLVKPVKPDHKKVKDVTKGKRKKRKNITEEGQSVSKKGDVKKSKKSEGSGGEPVDEIKKTKIKSKKKKKKNAKPTNSEHENDDAIEVLLLGDHKEDDIADDNDDDEVNNVGSGDEDITAQTKDDITTAMESPFQPTRNKMAFSEASKPKKQQNNGVTVDPRKIFRIEETSDSIGGDKSREHILNIQQAFANDDVIEEFAREKEDAIDASKPKDVDLTLPGWGEWGGTGVKLSEKKKQKIVIRAEPGPERKDKNLAHVIINEERNRKFARNQVKNVPHPYSNRTQFERTIRNPVGKQWNTASTVKQLTKPRVQTLMGTIIEPIGTPKQLKRKTNGDIGQDKGNKSRRNNDDEGAGLVIHK